MKLTWFGNDTFRIHSGGSIIVVEGDGDLDGVDRSELVSGADLVCSFAEPFQNHGPAWKPRAPLKMLDAGEAMRAPEISRLGVRAVAIDADGESPLVIAKKNVTLVGRWVGQSVIVLVGADLSARGRDLLGTHAPRLIALAGDETEVDDAFAALPGFLDGTALVALEQGLAVEI